MCSGSVQCGGHYGVVPSKLCDGEAVAREAPGPVQVGGCGGYPLRAENILGRWRGLAALKRSRVKKRCQVPSIDLHERRHCVQLACLRSHP